MYIHRLLTNIHKQTPTYIHTYTYVLTYIQTCIHTIHDIYLLIRTIHVIYLLMQTDLYVQTRIHTYTHSNKPKHVMNLGFPYLSAEGVGLTTMAPLTLAPMMLALIAQALLTLAPFA